MLTLKPLSQVKVGTEYSLTKTSRKFIKTNHETNYGDGKLIVGVSKEGYYSEHRYHNNVYVEAELVSVSDIEPGKKFDWNENEYTMLQHYHGINDCDGYYAIIDDKYDLGWIKKDTMVNKL